MRRRALEIAYLASIVLLVSLVAYWRHQRSAQLTIPRGSLAAGPKKTITPPPKVVPPKITESIDEYKPLSFEQLIERLRAARTAKDERAVRRLKDEIVFRGPRHMLSLIAQLEIDEVIRADLAEIIHFLQHESAVRPLLALLQRVNPTQNAVKNRALLEILQPLLRQLGGLARPEHVPDLERILYGEAATTGIYVRGMAFRLLLSMPQYDARDAITRVFRDLEITTPKSGAEQQLAEVKSFFEEVVRSILERFKDRAVPELMYAYTIADGKQADAAKDRILLGITQVYSAGESIPLLLEMARQYSAGAMEGFRFSGALAHTLEEPGAFLDLVQRLEGEPNPIAQVALVDVLNNAQDPRAADTLQRFIMSAESRDSGLARQNAIVALSRLNNNGPYNAYDISLPLLNEIVSKPNRYDDGVRFATASAIANLWEKNTQFEGDYVEKLQRLFSQSQEDYVKSNVVEILGQLGGASSLQYLKELKAAVALQSNPSKDLVTELNKAIQSLELRVKK